ncbi:uncharacterized protein An01g15080 [Aspergillus niger]|uniref:Contig An01c0490, genomic contig n=2 Tax=Aspergillus niger TaxID=5061 RepID=A2QBF7_ASPNC|nr:uncharacterized protein An01g15080 [Aspergillus niger]CAK37462.1 unnamed protein product [Aspergillus niger]
MPKSSKELVEQEGRLCLAVESIQKGHTKSIREVARVFQVPRSTLQDRLNGLKFRKDTRANSHKLTSIEEESLEKWIISLDQRGAPPKHSQVREMANLLLQKRGQNTTISVGQKWVTNYISRHDSLKSRYSRQINYKRAKYEEPKAIQMWFKRVQTAISTYGIVNKNIYNFDETGFAMGILGTTKLGTKEVYHLPGGLLYPQMDGLHERLGKHGSKITSFHISKHEEQIIPVYMPANSSHLCQPLDVACFSPLKKAYKDQVQQLIRTEYHHIEKVDFLDMYPKAHAQAFTKANIQSAFRASGLVPLNPSKILENMIFKKTSRPSSQSTSSSSIFTKTPRNSRQFKKYESTLSQLLQQQDTPATPIQSALSYIFKGAEVALNHTVLLEHENRQLREALDKRNTKQKRNQHQMDDLNGLTVQEALEAFNHARILEEQAGDAGPREDQPRRRAPPRCSACHIVGHIRTRCPNRAVS